MDCDRCGLKKRKSLKKFCDDCIKLSKNPYCKDCGRGILKNDVCNICTVKFQLNPNLDEKPKSSNIFERGLNWLGIGKKDF